MAPSPRFWNWVATWYSKNPVPDEAAYARKLDAAAARLTPSARVVEFGCGTGTTAVHLAPKAGHIEAVDFSARMLEIAQDRAANAGVSNITFTANTIEGFAGDPGAYDMVMMHSLLHLLPNPGAAVSKAYRLLAPGGWFLSSTTTLGDDGLALIANVMRPAAALGLLPRLTVFSGDDLRAMITGAGFEIVDDWKPKPKAAVFIVARKV
ncbi:MAG: class I SAM-dependent methyltransferase [Pseudomonadota bacterium]